MAIFKTTLILLLALVLSRAAVYRNDKLKFNENHSFTVLQLTDLHYGEGDDQKTFETQTNLIKMSSPDLVVVTGDMISGYVWDGKTQGWFESVWRDKFTKVFEDLKVNYLYVLGNHDDEGDLSREEILRLDMTHNYSRTNSSEEVNWTSTYHTPIYSSFNPEEIAVNLWSFDSMDMANILSWGRIDEEKISWYKAKAAELKWAQPNLTSYAFFHIPLPEYVQLWNNEPVSGDKQEDVACPLKNTGVFTAFKEVGDVKAAFCGHDHDNYYAGFYEGIELNYGRKSGYGSYGPPAGVKRGATVIKFTEAKDPKTGEILITKVDYTLEEDGTIVNKNYTKREYKHQWMCAVAWQNIYILYFFEKLAYVGLVILSIVVIWYVIRKYL